jgi:hypothetical protein
MGYRIESPHELNDAPSKPSAGYQLSVGQRRETAASPFDRVDSYNASAELATA